MTALPSSLTAPKDGQRSKLGKTIGKAMTEFRPRSVLVVGCSTARRSPCSDPTSTAT